MVGKTLQWIGCVWDEITKIYPIPLSLEGIGSRNSSLMDPKGPGGKKVTFFHFNGEVLLKVRLWGFLALCAASLTAQEMIVNGTFDHGQEGWTVYHLDSSTPCVAEFGLSDGLGPSKGEGPYLFLYGEADAYVNILVWQELRLIVGRRYRLSGAFRDLTPQVTGTTLTNFWCELYLSTEAPVEGQDWTPPNKANTDDLMSFNTWAGCGPGVDGTFEDNGCGSARTPFYTPPGTPGTEVTVYFGIKTGFWISGQRLYFAVAIDNISLVPADTRVETAPKNPSGFVLYPNYPNPFNAETTLRFALPEASDLRLAIFDGRGRCVRHLFSGMREAGIYTLIWDGRNDGGRELVSGRYLLRLEAGSLSEARPLILSR